MYFQITITTFHCHHSRIFTVTVQSTNFIPCPIHKCYSKPQISYLSAGYCTEHIAVCLSLPADDMVPTWELTPCTRVFWEKLIYAQLPCSQQPATSPYHQSLKSSPYPRILTFPLRDSMCLNTIFPSYVSQMFSSFQILWSKFCMHFSSL